MTRNDKINLLRVITRPSMHIIPEDENNTISFIYGYTMGTNDECNFIELLKQLLTEKYRINYSNDGWPGQIKKLAKRQSSSWFTIFRKIALEIITDERNGGLDKEMTEILKSRFISLINRIRPIGDPWFDESWSEEWSTLCAIKSEWFKKMWNDKEWKAFKAINQLVRTNSIFLNVNEDKKKPTLQLIKLREQYDKANNYRADN